MPWLVIEGAKPYDGRYELNLAGLDFTIREWGWIKRLAGYLPLNVDEGFAGGDPELYAVLAAIALYRAGRVDQPLVPDVFNRLADAPFATTIRLEADPDEDDAEDDAGPPAKSSNANAPSSGGVSTTNSETSPPSPAGSGTPDSDTSESHPIKSVI